MTRLPICSPNHWLRILLSSTTLIYAVASSLHAWFESKCKIMRNKNTAISSSVLYFIIRVFLTYCGGLQDKTLLIPSFTITSWCYGIQVMRLWLMKSPMSRERGNETWNNYFISSKSIYRSNPHVTLLNIFVWASQVSLFDMSAHHIFQVDTVSPK